MDGYQVVSQTHQNKKMVEVINQFVVFKLLSNCLPTQSVALG